MPPAPRAHDAAFTHRNVPRGYKDTDPKGLSSIPAEPGGRRPPAPAAAEPTCGSQSSSWPRSTTQGERVLSECVSPPCLLSTSASRRANRRSQRAPLLLKPSEGRQVVTRQPAARCPTISRSAACGATATAGHTHRELGTCRQRGKQGVGRRAGGWNTIYRSADSSRSSRAIINAITALLVCSRWL